MRPGGSRATMGKDEEVTCTLEASVEHDRAKPLDRELAFFRAHLAEWLASYLGKFALVRDEALVGTFDTAEAAYQVGVAQFGTEPFLVRKILASEAPAQAPALFTGLISLQP